VPNIMKIRQCFLELQLKMSGMFFFETHCIWQSNQCWLAGQVHLVTNNKV